MSDGIWIYGAAGHAKVIIQAILSSGQSVGGVVDDNPDLMGARIIGFEIQPVSSIPDSVPLVIAIGNNQVRKQIVDRFDSQQGKQRWPTIVHPTAIVDSTVKLGAGTVVMAGAVLQADTVIGDHSIVNTRSSVDHDVCVGDFCHVCPGATIAGHVSINQLVMIGTGANVVPCVTIDEMAIIGAGACVVSDVPASCVAIGVPARIKTNG